jgi:ElaB/YqjD/DUF883 family membrane-anchored ribosome-binding protein
MNATSERPGSNPDPEQLERSAERIRADLDATLDALERKLSPSQLLDRSLDYLRDHGGDLAVAVGDSVRRNPVPILVTVAGLGWLIATAVRSRASIDVTPIDDTLDDEFDDDDEFAESSFAGQHTLRGRLHDRVAAARARTRQAQYRAVSALEERPLLFGGLAVALGALLGAIVPSTEYEDKFVGQVRDRAVERAKQMGERQYQNLRSRFDNPDLEVSGQAH